MALDETAIDEEVDRLDGNMNALFGKVSDLADRVETLEAELEEERRKRKAAEDIAETALGIANELDTGARGDGGPSKVDRARFATRNELVRQASKRNGKAAITTSKAKDLCRPELDPAWQTVMDAWTKLSEQWSAFNIDRRDEKDHRLKFDVAHVDKALLRAVERDLGEDGLTKLLVGGRD
jgi:outer membrane murein-binding lipoprotein Lpp